MTANKKDFLSISADLVVLAAGYWYAGCVCFRNHDK